jgi:plasmid stabilization system protein ParE
MSRTVRELPKAKQDKDSIFRWLYQRSPQGAFAWLDAYDAMVERLKADALTFASAPESADCDADIRQALFRTRRGRVYRALFFIDRDEVFVLRVRGPGQAAVFPDELT